MPTLSHKNARPPQRPQRMTSVTCPDRHSSGADEAATGVTGKQGDMTRNQAGVTGRQADVTRKQHDVTAQPDTQLVV